MIYMHVMSKVYICSGLFGSAVDERMRNDLCAHCA